MFSNKATLRWTPLTFPPESLHVSSYFWFLSLSFPDRWRRKRQSNPYLNIFSFRFNRLYCGTLSQSINFILIWIRSGWTQFWWLWLRLFRMVDALFGHHSWLYHIRRYSNFGSRMINRILVSGYFIAAFILEKHVLSFGESKGHREAQGLLCTTTT